MKDAEYYMTVTRMFKGERYQLIELPFERIEDAKHFAKRRMKEYPEGKQKTVPSKNKKYWGVYEKMSWDHLPEHIRERIGHSSGEKK